MKTQIITFIPTSFAPPPPKKKTSVSPPRMSLGPRQNTSLDPSWSTVNSRETSLGCGRQSLIRRFAGAACVYVCVCDVSGEGADEGGRPGRSERAGPADTQPVHWRPSGAPPPTAWPRRRPPPLFLPRSLLSPLPLLHLFRPLSLALKWMLLLAYSPCLPDVAYYACPLHRVFESKGD